MRSYILISLNAIHVTYNSVNKFWLLNINNPNLTRLSQLKRLYSVETVAGSGLYVPNLDVIRQTEENREKPSEQQVSPSRIEPNSSPIIV